MDNKEYDLNFQSLIFKGDFIALVINAKCLMGDPTLKHNKGKLALALRGNPSLESNFRGGGDLTRGIFRYSTGTRTRII